MTRLSFGDPDNARDAALLDGLGDVGRAQRLSPRGMQQSPAYLRGRRDRLATRLREEGGEPGVLVDGEDAAKIWDEVLRLEQAIGEALKVKREPVMGLDEPGAGEALAAE